MSSKPILIAQISDLHIKSPGMLAYGRVDTARALERCIETLNAFAPKPDLVVISGDLVDTPTRQEYDHLKRLLDHLDLPFLSVPGNHDSRELMRTAFPHQVYSSPTGALNQLHSIGVLDIFLLDSSVSGKPYGQLDAQSLLWLESTLASSKDRPALLFLHHPPFETGIWHMDGQNLLNADVLAGVICRHSRIQLIASGHVHRGVAASFAGVTATICPAPNHSVDLDLGKLREPSFRVEPPAFHLHAWYPGKAFGHVVTHTIPLGEFDGPHPFFGPDGKLL